MEKKRKEDWSEKKSFFFMAMVCAVFVIDRYTKLLSSLVEGCFVFCIKRSVNYGAAFSLLSDFAWVRVLLITIAVLVLFFTAFFYFQNKKFGHFYVGLTLLFAGTLSNLFDRVFYGYVVDFLTFSFLPVQAFNLADISNLVGVIILIYSLFENSS